MATIGKFKREKEIPVGKFKREKTNMYHQATENEKKARKTLEDEYKKSRAGKY